MKLMELPDEILLEIIQHIFPPWSAWVSYSCELSRIENVQILRVNKLFHNAGLRALQKSFTGELQRYDRRGRIVDVKFAYGPWYAWFMENTTTLHLLDSPSSTWYITNYWRHYPRLKRFCISITHDTACYNQSTDIHGLQQRQKRCDAITTRWLNGELDLRRYMWGELRRVWHDMLQHERETWPELEIRNVTCSCHASRQTVCLHRRSNSI